MKPTIYHFKDHLISPKNLDINSIYIILKLKQYGYTAYLVGGSVRDLLLKQIPKDFDISTSAKPEEIKKIFKNCFLIGKRFRLAHIKFGKKIIEVSTFRAGEISSTFIKENNIWGTAQEDAFRRDFTINALFYDPENQIIIDYVGGFEDSKEKILKTIGDPITKFIQDPVRMIRLLKFKARFNFKIEKTTLLALKNCKKEITKSSQARILEELLRMLESGSSENFFKLLQEHGILFYLLPEISTFLKKSKKIFNLLKQADIHTCKHGSLSLDRSILLSCLIFPILENKISSKNLNLFHIAQESKKLINQSFSHFFHISKKIKLNMISILTNQFRFNFTLKKKVKIPKDHSFILSLQFFKLRAMHQKTLFKKYNIWHENFIKSHKNFHQRLE